MAVVTARVTFTPDQISILSKLCNFGGQMVSCFKAKVCFRAEFKPSNSVGPAGTSLISNNVLLFYIQIKIFVFIYTYVYDTSTQCN